MLLSGADASTSITSQSDPRPVLARLIDPGTLPRKFMSDLKDCHIVASGYGDISSERVFTRLEKLTCIKRVTGEVVETEVADYIAGEDGRAGIKGVGGYLGKSIIGGVLQGVAGVMAPERNIAINPLGAIMEKRSYGDKFKEGSMNGVGSSMERLSKYYIERAESIQPIIQVASGRIVDVVFTEGAGIGTKRVKKILEMRRQTQENREDSINEQS
ncbi:conjugal transfer pilus assembly protein TraB [Alphaproteobacteria bacterium]